MRKESSELLLLDVNVLLALAWPNHQFPAAANRRLENTRTQWATCALAELGFIPANPAVVGAAKTAAEVASLLAGMTADPQHRYFDALPSPLSERFSGSFDRIYGHQQVTDAYLAALAQRHGAVFVTFDPRLAALESDGARIEVLK